VFAMIVAASSTGAFGRWSVNPPGSAQLENLVAHRSVVAVAMVGTTDSGRLYPSQASEILWSDRRGTGMRMMSLLPCPALTFPPPRSLWPSRGVRVRVRFGAM
jgi:hypothetical protein